MFKIFDEAKGPLNPIYDAVQAYFQEQQESLRHAHNAFGTFQPLSYRHGPGFCKRGGWGVGLPQCPAS